jgi:hypothetical protein
MEAFLGPQAQAVPQVNLLQSRWRILPLELLEEATFFSTPLTGE